MVFAQTILKCIDNSGGLLVKCLKVLGKSPKSKGFPGDYVIVSIKTCRANKKVRRGEIYKAILVRVGYRIKRNSDITVQCSSCGVVLLSRRREALLGSRILGPVMEELRIKNHLKIISMAPAII